MANMPILTPVRHCGMRERGELRGISQIILAESLSQSLPLSLLNLGSAISQVKLQPRRR